MFESVKDIVFSQNPGVVLALIFGLVVVAGLAGRLLANGLRVADYGTKFAIIIIAILASSMELVRGWPPKLGVDLGGGSILVYQVDKSKHTWNGTAQEMDALIASLLKRVNPGGQKEISVRSLGNDMVQIVMPSVSGSTDKDKQVEAEEIRRIIATTGALEFRIVACNRDNAMLIERAKAERKKFPAHTPTVKIFEGGKEKAKWCPIRDDEVSKMRSDSTISEAVINVGKKTVKDSSGKDVEKDAWEALVLSPESPKSDVTGSDLRDARRGNDENGTPEVVFSFYSAGGMKFSKLTGDHVPIGDFKYHLAIVLDDELVTAPTINTIISDNGRITSESFKEKEVDAIVSYINAGSLPAALDSTPVRDMTTDATLGADTIAKSVWAMKIASIAVPLFMLFYYRFAGLVAVLVLGLNMLMLVALMILIKAPFTLPALAGLALTVGMAVDNNILLYERLREELAHGAALRMAIRNSFHRVGVVVIDANITHLIAATVLWSVGTEQVKGFAITFWLGAVLSIWATMFVARVLFEVAERRRWIQKLVMMQWIGHTKIDFMAWFPACATFSVVITVLGICIAMVRGQGLFDIDFTGGVSVQAVFQKAQDISYLRDEVAKNETILPDATITPAKNEGEPDNYRFIFDTSNGTMGVVKNKLQELFGDKLTRVDVKYRIVSSGTEKPESKREDKTPEKPVAPSATKPAEAVKPKDKPSDPPVDKSQPHGTGEKATGEKAPGAKATGDKLPEPRPSAGKTSDLKPEENKARQSRSDLPSDSLVAMAGPEAVLLALADPPPAKSTAATAEVKSGTLGPKAEVKAPAKSDTKAEVKAPAKAEVKAPATSGTKAEAKPPAKSDTKADVKAPAKSDEKSEPKPASQPAEQVFQATLTLTSSAAQLKDTEQSYVEQQVKYDLDNLKKVIGQALEENGIPVDQVRIDLAPHDQSSSTKSDVWDLKLRPNYESRNPLTPKKFQAVLASLRSDMLKTPYFPIADNIGSAVAHDTQFWAVVALVSSWSLIIMYLWIRFQGVAFGLAAVIALVHDVLVMLGAIAFSSYLAQVPGLSMLTGIEPFKINLQIVAAFLTIIGYSVNDTIVVFDRIREIRGKSPTLTRQMVNDATNQMLSRTVLTSFTVMLVVVILYIWGGQAVHGFAFALIIGVLTGTYSSIYVAAPILLWLLHPKEMTANSGK
jgi:SecD/SecF fusion protein